MTRSKQQNPHKSCW